MTEINRGVWKLHGSERASLRRRCGETSEEEEEPIPGEETQGEQQEQRIWGGFELGMFKEMQGGQVAGGEQGRRK